LYNRVADDRNTGKNIAEIAIDIDTEMNSPLGIPVSTPAIPEMDIESYNVVAENVVLMAEDDHNVSLTSDEKIELCENLTKEFSLGMSIAEAEESLEEYFNLVYSGRRGFANKKKKNTAKNKIGRTGALISTMQELPNTASRPVLNAREYAIKMKIKNMHEVIRTNQEILKGLQRDLRNLKSEKSDTPYIQEGSRLKLFTNVVENVYEDVNKLLDYNWLFTHGENISGQFAFDKPISIIESLENEFTIQEINALKDIIPTVANFGIVVEDEKGKEIEISEDEEKLLRRYRDYITGLDYSFKFFEGRLDHLQAALQKIKLNQTQVNLLERLGKLSSK
jgi:hypothetical protein